MVDSIGLTFHKYRIRSLNQIAVELGCLQGGTGEIKNYKLFDGPSGEVRGFKAFANRGGVGVTFRPRKFNKRSAARSDKARKTSQVESRDKMALSEYDNNREHWVGRHLHSLSDAADTVDVFVDSPSLDASACQDTGSHDASASEAGYPDQEGKGPEPTEGQLVSAFRQGGVSNGPMFVEVSLPRLADGRHNLVSTPAEEIETQLLAVQEILYSMGIEADVMSATVHRLDLCRDFELDHPLEDYLLILRQLNSERTKKRSYPHGHSWNNKQHGVTIYDKKQEMTDKGLAQFVTTQSRVRVEYRIKSARKIRDLTLIKTAADLCGVSDSFLRELYDSAIGRILPCDIDGQYFNASVLGDEIRQYKESNGGKWISNYLINKGVEFLLQTVGEEEILALVKRVGGNRMNVSRMRKLIQSTNRIKFLGDADSGDSKARSLYTEIRNKALNALSSDTPFVPYSTSEINEHLNYC